MSDEIREYNLALEKRVLAAFRAAGATVDQDQGRYISTVNGNPVRLTSLSNCYGFNKARGLSVKVEGFFIGVKAVVYKIKPTSEPDVTESELKAFVEKLLIRINQNQEARKADEEHRAKVAQQAKALQSKATEIEEALQKAGYPARIALGSDTVRSVTFEGEVAQRLIEFLTR